MYDIGTDDDGHLFFAMKRIEGITLHDIFVGLRNNATVYRGAIYMRSYSLHSNLSVWLLPSRILAL